MQFIVLVPVKTGQYLNSPVTWQPIAMTEAEDAQTAVTNAAYEYGTSTIAVEKIED